MVNSSQNRSCIHDIFPLDTHTGGVRATARMRPYHIRMKCLQSLCYPYMVGAHPCGRPGCANKWDTPEKIHTACHTCAVPSLLTEAINCPLGDHRADHTVLE